MNEFRVKTGGPSVAGSASVRNQTDALPFRASAESRQAARPSEPMASRPRRFSFFAPSNAGSRCICATSTSPAQPAPARATPATSSSPACPFQSGIGGTPTAKCRGCCGHTGCRRRVPHGVAADTAQHRSAAIRAPPRHQDPSSRYGSTATADWRRSFEAVIATAQAPFFITSVQLLTGVSQDIEKQHFFMSQVLRDQHPHPRDT